MYHDEAMESKMHGYFWPADHPAALLALVAFAILAFAWPLENVAACVLAAVMVVGAMRVIGWRGWSGGVVSRQYYDLDAVLEFDALYDFRQLVFTL